MALPTPRSWSTSEDLTAARMNTLRDGLAALNGAFGVIADNPNSSGTSTFLKITRPVSAGTGHRILEGWEAGDITPRIYLTAKGFLGFTDGQSSAGHHVFFNATDGIIETPSAFRADAMEIISGSLVLDAQPSTEASAYIRLPLLTANTLQPPAGTAHLYIVVSAGQTRLRVQFANGTVVDLAAAGAAV